MEPFYFDAAGTELFGIYHPASDPGARRAVVLCHPFGNETTRTYQTTRVLAQRWSEKAHVLRFDYAGTGDSFGAWDQAGPERWIADIEVAAEELAAISGAENIVLAGIRFGGLLAAHAAARMAATELILWDPVSDASQYRNELSALHQTLIDLHVNLTPAERTQAQSELCGFETTTWMEAQMTALSMPTSLPAELKSVSIIETTNQSGADRLAEGWADNARKVHCQKVDFDCAWNTDLEGLLNPSPVIEELVRCL